MDEQKINMDSVAVSEAKTDKQSMSDLQVYGVNSVVVRLLSKMRKYTLLTQIQMELVNKPHQVQPVMREMYQYEETKMIMEIREEFDMFYAYHPDKIVTKNSEDIREKFEQAISFITSNMQTIKTVLDKGYVEILDSFADKLQQLSTSIATKSIYDEHFKA